MRPEEQVVGVGRVRRPICGSGQSFAALGRNFRLQSVTGLDSSLTCRRSWRGLGDTWIVPAAVTKGQSFLPNYRHELLTPIAPPATASFTIVPLTKRLIPPPHCRLFSTQHLLVHCILVTCMGVMGLFMIFPCINLANILRCSIRFDQTTAPPPTTLQTLRTKSIRFSSRACPSVIQNIHTEPQFHAHKQSATVSSKKEKEEIRSPPFPYDTPSHCRWSYRRS